MEPASGCSLNLLIKLQGKVEELNHTGFAGGSSSWEDWVMEGREFRERCSIGLCVRVDGARPPRVRTVRYRGCPSMPEKINWAAELLHKWTA